VIWLRWVALACYAAGCGTLGYLLGRRVTLRGFDQAIDTARRLAVEQHGVDSFDVPPAVPYDGPIKPLMGQHEPRPHPPGRCGDPNCGGEW
jgi:hypothetical protein